MSKTNYVKGLPFEPENPVLFTFVNYDLISSKLKKKIHGLTVPQLRQLLALKIATNQRRKLYLGVCQWFKLTPSNGLTYSYRRSSFEVNLKILETSGFIEVLPVSRGQIVRLTVLGEQVVNEVSNFLTDYYKRIFAQFNLTPVI
jgi:hypothetical protein